MSTGDGRRARRPAGDGPRPYQISMKLSAAEHDLVDAAAARTGLKASAWLVDAGVAAAQTALDPEFLQRSVADAARIVGAALPLTGGLDPEFFEDVSRMRAAALPVILTRLLDTPPRREDTP